MKEMSEKFVDYLKLIGMEYPFINRVQDIYEFYVNVCPEEITDIFVTDYIKQDGDREYENLWFFSKSYIMEAKNALTGGKDDFDMMPLLNNIYYWVVKKQDYNFLKATDKSRMYIEITLNARLIGNFKASKENCDYLKDIFHKHILPNFKSLRDNK